MYNSIDLVDENLIEKFEKYSKKEGLWEAGEGIVVGVSGGADSLCLLYFFCAIKKKYKLNIYGIHIHHGIRGREADEDALYAKKIADEWGIPFEIRYVKVIDYAKETGLTEEEAGRKLRYEEFEKYRKEVGAQKIAVAHHENDRSETILFNLFRGSGPRGLVGIPVKRDRIIRPLLFLSRQEIENILRANNISWKTDSTNKENIYSRNYIRNRLLPEIEKNLNPLAGKHIAMAGEYIAKMYSFVERLALEEYKECLVYKNKSIGLNIGRLEGLDEVLWQQVIFIAMKSLFAGLKDIENIHYQQIKQLMEKKSGTKIDLPCGMGARVDYGVLEFFLRENERYDSLFLEVNGSREKKTYIFENMGEKYGVSLEIKDRKDLSAKILEKEFTKWFDYDIIRDGLVLRNPLDGDYFIINSQGGRKKIGKYMIDQKISKHLRKNQIVLAEANHVLWFFGGRISEKYKVSCETKKVLVVEIFKQGDSVLK